MSVDREIKHEVFCSRIKLLIDIWKICRCGIEGTYKGRHVEAIFTIKFPFTILTVVLFISHHLHL